MFVMVIDPDEKHLMRTKACLARDGTQVVAFSDAMSAVQYGYNHDVDAVFTEVVMPHISGREIVNLLRKHNPVIRTYFLTDTNQYLNVGRKCGIAGYYLKPLAGGLQRVDLLQSEAAVGIR